MSAYELEAESLAYAYPDGNRALCDLSFRIKQGESVGVVGANGAGKSTLLLLIAGALFPAAGALRVGDVLVHREKRSCPCRRVGLVFQSPDDQLFMPSVLDDVAFGPRALGLSPDEVEERVGSALRVVDGEHLARRPPHRLSGGEKKVVALAAILSMAPTILALDEPSSALDPRSRRRVIELLKRMAQTKLIATHDLDLVLDLCPRCLVLKDGRLLADGPTLQLFADDALLSAGGLERPLRWQGVAPA